MTIPAPRRLARVAAIAFVILSIGTVGVDCGWFDQQVLAAAPVAAFSFNETSGTTAANIGNPAVNGVVSGAAWTTAGKNGGALSFDGVNDKVSVADYAALDLTNKMTLSAWVRPTSLTNWRTVMFKERPSGIAYSLYATDGVNRPPSLYSYIGTDRIAVGTSVLPVNAWSHLTGTYDGTNMRLYVNGALVATRAQTGNITTSNNPLSIGGNSIWGEYFAGLIDDVRVYNIALAAAEVVADMNTPVQAADSTAPTAPTNLAATVISGTQVNLSWTAATDNVAVTGYRIMRGGVQIGTSATTSFGDATATAGSTYAYTVRAIDAAGNVSPDSTSVNVTTPVPDTTAPVISAISAGSITQTTSTIGWTTNEASDTQVEYGATVAYGASTSLNASWVTSHSANLSGLATSTVYHYRVKSKDAAGNLATSGDNVFTTTADTTAPTPPSNLVAAPISGTQVDLSWIASTDNVGVTGYYILRDNIQIDTSATTSFGDTTAIPGTAYTYTVRAVDAAGNQSLDSNIASVTTPVPDPAPPIINEITASSITQTTATITWTTDEASDTQVEYGITAAYGSSTTLDGSLVTNHSTGLSNLAANTTYHYRVKSKDATGNLAISDDNVLTTTADTTPPSAPIVTATGVSASQINISWTASTDASGIAGYNVYRGTSFSTITTQVNSTLLSSNTLSLGDSGLIAGTTYYYQVEAVDGVTPLANTAKSNVASATTATTSVVQANCFSNPGACGYPDASTAGAQGALTPVTQASLPSGVSWNAQNEVLSINQAGVTISNLDVPGAIEVHASNVTIRNVKVTLNSGCPSTFCGSYGILLGASNESISGTFLDSVSIVTKEKNPNNDNPRDYSTFDVKIEHAVRNNSDQSARANKLYIKGPGSDWKGVGTIENSYLWAQYVIKDDHAENILNGGEGHLLVLNHNTMFMPNEFTAVIANFDDYGPVEQVTVTNNFLVGGGVTIYGGVKGSAANVKGPFLIKDNRFARCLTPEVHNSSDGGSDCQNGPDSHGFYPRGGHFDTFADFKDSVTQSCGNYWDDNLAPINGPGSACTSTPPPPPDQVAPSAPIGLQATGSIGAVSLSWAEATDNVGVTAYSVYRSTTANFTSSPINKIAQTAGTTYTDLGVSAGTYYYQVRAQDAAGNIGSSSNEVSAVVTSDTEAPTVSLTSPSNGAVVNGTVAFSATATDNISVAGVTFLVNGVASGLEDTSAPYSLSWNSSSVANGTYSITARARDPAGNTTTSGLATITVNNTVPSNLIAAYNFNEGSGASANDSTASNNMGTINGATWTVLGRYGSALSFNGSSNMVTIADANELDLTTGMTLEAWVRPTSLTNWSTVILKEAGNNLAYSLYAANNGGQPPSGYAQINGDRSTVGSSALPLNVWSHLAFTYNGSALCLYVNGILVSTTNVSGSISASTGALKIGGNSIWGEYFNGLIDEVRIYNRALTAAEIQTDLSAPL